MSLEKINTHKDVYPAIAPETYSKEEFEGKVVIVTGSGSGIGKATALAFSELGAKVAFTDLTIEAAQSAADEAKSFGNKTVAVAGNVTKLKDMEKLVAETTQKLGPVDCIVFAAGYGMFDKFEVSRSDDWWGLVETNLKGPTDLTRLVLPDMIKRNTGTLIYIASRAAIGDNPYSTAYNVSKAGIVRFAGTLQNELKDTNIRTFVLHPGQVGTTKLSDINYVTKDYVRKAAPEIPKLIEGVLMTILDCTPKLPAWSCCFLFTAKANELKGRYIDCCQDLGELVKRIDEIKEKRLYILKADCYPTDVVNLRESADVKSVRRS